MPHQYLMKVSYCIGRLWSTFVSLVLSFFCYFHILRHLKGTNQSFCGIHLCFGLLSMVSCLNWDYALLRKIHRSDLSPRPMSDQRARCSLFLVVLMFVKVSLTIFSSANLLFYPPSILYKCLISPEINPLSSIPAFFSKGGVFFLLFFEIGSHIA